jgi:hypothetical protein
MDTEKLKFLKKEVKLLEKQYNVWAQRFDEAEKLWDVLRYDCEFYNKDGNDICEHSQVEEGRPCDPEVCPLG